jgi:ribulose-5-phosphate 4-epimerase/fuculose-1-phosphate aldolase
MITSICNVMKEGYDRGWITTRDGNCSLIRNDETRFYITPSAVRKNVIISESILRIRVDPDYGLDLEDGMNPSGELEMHWLLHKDYRKTRCVLHLHPTYTVAAMHAGWSLPKLVEPFPELYRYTKVGPNVPNLPATSPELATATYHSFAPNEQGLSVFDIVGQTNHGVTAIAATPWDAFEHIERLEHISQIVLASGISPVGE